jgi:hypothetical protein
MSGDPRWQVLKHVESRLVELFGSDGVTEVRLGAAFPQVNGVDVWLCTLADDEKAHLQAKPHRMADVKTVLRNAGFSDVDVAKSTVTVQSQETVDRDFEGSWFYATR